MQSGSSLDHLIESKDLFENFSTALQGEDNRKQIFELLSALCVYSKEGYGKVLDVLDEYKRKTKTKYRFSLIVEDLQRSRNVHYKVILLEFINCVISYSSTPIQRISIRNEFYALKLQNILQTLRCEDEQHIITQLQIYDDNKINDEEIICDGNTIDLSSAHDLFNALYMQVAQTPYEVCFITCLQHLLKIDSTEPTSDVIWNTVEKLISNCVQDDTPTDNDKTPRKRYGSNACDDNQNYPNNDIFGDNLCNSRICNGEEHQSVQVPPPPPPPAAPPPPVAPPPPPPAPPAPPGPPSASPLTVPLQASKSALPQQNIPKPHSKMRSLPWQKIPIAKVLGKKNLWTQVGEMFDGYKVDYVKMDDLFSIDTSSHMSPLIEPTSGDRMKRENSKVTLIDGRRSLNVNIFLKQFRLPYEEIVRFLQDGHSDKFGSDKLRSLQKLLPTKEEVDKMKSFDGDKETLEMAEKFFMCLIDLPHYSLQIESLLMKEEFNDFMEWIRPAVETVIVAGKDILTNHSLFELIYLVLIAGNYLNSGNYAGNAAGFKLSSLVKLTEIRANKPHMNLMHYVVMEAEEKNPHLLDFPREMNALSKASLVSIESLSSDILSMDKKLSAIGNHMKTVKDSFTEEMHIFFRIASFEIKKLKEGLKDIEETKQKLADFFCEDPSTFKLEECYKTLDIFCDRFKKAVEENYLRKMKEEKASIKRKLTQELLKQKDESKEGYKKGLPENDESLLEILLADVRSGYASQKLDDESSFSVTKVKKVQLDKPLNVPTSPAPSEDSNFVRNGLGRVSMRRSNSQKQMSPSTSRYSDSPLGNHSLSDDSSLLNLLVSGNSDNDNKLKTDMNGSFRRRRKERPEAKDLSNMLDTERERASSPATDLLLQERQTTKTSPLRRTQSLMNKTSKLKSGLEDIGEDILMRIKHKIYNKKDTPEVKEQEVKDEKSYSKPAKTRWRNGILSAESLSLCNIDGDHLKEGNKKIKTEEKETYAIRNSSETDEDAGFNGGSSFLHCAKDKFVNRNSPLVESNELNTSAAETNPDVTISISEKLNRTYNFKEDLKKVETGEAVLESTDGQDNSFIATTPKTTRNRYQAGKQEVDLNRGSMRSGRKLIMHTNDENMNDTKLKLREDNIFDRNSNNLTYDRCRSDIEKEKLDDEQNSRTNLYRSKSYGETESYLKNSTNDEKMNTVYGLKENDANTKYGMLPNGNVNEIGSRMSYASTCDTGYNSSISESNSQRASMVSTQDASDYPTINFRNSANKNIEEELEDSVSRASCWTVSTIEADYSSSNARERPIKTPDINNPTDISCTESEDDCVKMGTKKLKNKIDNSESPMKSKVKSKAINGSLQRNPVSKSRNSESDKLFQNKNNRASMRVALTLRRSADPSLKGRSVPSTPKSSPSVKSSTNTSAKGLVSSTNKTASPRSTNSVKPSPKNTPPAKTIPQASTPSITRSPNTSQPIALSTKKQTNTTNKPLNRTQSLRHKPNEQNERKGYRPSFMEPTASFKASCKELKKVPEKNKPNKSLQNALNIGTEDGRSNFSRNASIRRSVRLPSTASLSGDKSHTKDLKKPISKK